jgi:hypothetical protein
MSRETGWYRVKVAVDAAVISGWQFAYWYESSNSFKLIFYNEYIKESQCLEIDETRVNPMPADDVKIVTRPKREKLDPETSYAAEPYKSQLEEITIETRVVKEGE